MAKTSGGKGAASKGKGAPKKKVLTKHHPSTNQHPSAIVFHKHGVLSEGKEEARTGIYIYFFLYFEIIGGKEVWAWGGSRGQEVSSPHRTERRKLSPCEGGRVARRAL